MSVFESVTLGWNGEEYTIPANKVLGLIAKVEQIVTLKELSESQQNPRVVKIAEAYSVALNYAGASVHWEQVYDHLIGEFLGGEPSVVFGALESLMALMIPPRHLVEDNGSEGDSGNAEADSS